MKRSLPGSVSTATRCTTRRSARRAAPRALRFSRGGWTRAASVRRCAGRAGTDFDPDRLEAYRELTSPGPASAGRGAAGPAGRWPAWRRWAWRAGSGRRRGGPLPPRGGAPRQGGDGPDRPRKPAGMVAAAIVRDEGPRGPSRQRMVDEQRDTGGEVLDEVQHQVKEPDSTRSCCSTTTTRPWTSSCRCSRRFPQAAGRGLSHHDAGAHAGPRRLRALPVRGRRDQGRRGARNRPARRASRSRRPWKRRDRRIEAGSVFSAALEIVLTIAYREAASRRHTHLTLEHLLYALAHDPDGEKNPRRLRRGSAEAAPGPRHVPRAVGRAVPARPAARAGPDAGVPPRAADGRAARAERGAPGGAGGRRAGGDAAAAQVATRRSCWSRRASRVSTC